MRLAEELLVLLANDGGGDMTALPHRTLRFALAGAVLLDLALERRIDTDPKRLWLIDRTPLGDDLLDPTLAEIAAADAQSPETWVRQVADGVGALQERALARIEDPPAIERGVHVRLFASLFGPEDALPSPREACLIALVHTCGLFQSMLTPAQYEHVRDRIELFARLELTAQAVATALRTVTAAESLEELQVRNEGRKGWPIADGRLPFLGNGLRLTGDLCKYFVEQYHRHGPVFEIRAPGHRSIVLAGQEANVLIGREGKTLFRTAPYWAGYARAVGTSHVITALDGAPHRTLRRTLRDGFSGQHADRRVGVMVDIARAFVEEHADGRPVTVADLLRKIATEQLGILAAGTSARPYYRDIVVYTQALMNAHIAKRIPAALVMGPKVRRARQRLEGFAAEILRSHERERPQEERDLIDDVLDLHRTDPGFLGHADLFVNVLAPFFAGVDTVAAAIPMTLYDILSRRDVLARVLREVDDVFADGPLTGDSIARMVDTRHAVMETLRMRPMAPATAPRFVVNSFTLDGHRILYGSMVMFAMTVTHFLPEHFPNPYEYDIDRYANPRREHAQKGAYVPFGLGHHTCVGRQFAEIQSVATLATLLRYAEMEMSPPGYRLTVRHMPSVRPSPSFKVRMHPRIAPAAPP